MLFREIAAVLKALHLRGIRTMILKGADADFWQGAVPITVHDVETLTLNVTDQLLKVCVHGARWNDVPSIRWAADAMMMLQGTGTPVDWQRLLEQCRKRLLVLPMRDTLSHLASTLEAPVPEYVLEGLRQANSDEERLDYEFRSTAPWDWPRRKPSILGLLPVAWFRHCRQSGLASDATTIRKLMKFPGYFRHFFHVDRSWKLPFFFAYKCGQRIYRMLSWHTKRAASPRLTEMSRV